LKLIEKKRIGELFDWEKTRLHRNIAAKLNQIGNRLREIGSENKRLKPKAV